MSSSSATRNLDAARSTGPASTPPAIPAAGVLRLKLGDAVVTALLDGGLDFRLPNFAGVGEAEAAALLDRECRRMPIRAALNAYLVQVAGRTALIDTGAANGMGPGVGRLPAALSAAGVDPAEIDLVALTHLHADHADRVLVAGMHLDFPGFGHVQAGREAGSYRFVPLPSQTAFPVSSP